MAKWSGPRTSFCWLISGKITYLHNVVPVLLLELISCNLPKSIICWGFICLFDFICSRLHISTYATIDRNILAMTEWIQRGPKLKTLTLSFFHLPILRACLPNKRSIASWYAVTLLLWHPLKEHVEKGMKRNTIIFLSIYGGPAAEDISGHDLQYYQIMQARV